MKKFIFSFFILVSSIAFLSQLPDSRLHIYVCDVGQGDGILITYKYTQIVIDGGPDNSIENCLGSHIPFWDHTIEVAVMTHADSDHSFGFIEMAKRYTIKNFLGSSIDNSSNEFSQLKQELIDKKIKVMNAKAGDEIKVGKLGFKIIFPDDNFLYQNSKPKDSAGLLGSRSGTTNDHCAIAYFTFQKFTALFACDTSLLSESTMLSEGIVPHAYFLKVPHHGSKNGLTQSFLEAVNPKLAVISVGVKNPYGHPSPEVIGMLKNAGVKTLRTDQAGEIEVTTDGNKVWVKP